ncbi:MAG: hypothetical protein HWD61_11245 [Parachlamydiaceae bacterium]|nr:MAG: hypothetical protein HWD61_11245 [Parachlamydiaceae bacterium]
MAKITHSESLKISDPYSQRTFEGLSKSHGRQWSELKDKLQLKSTIQSMARIEAHVFKNLTEQECETFLNPILDFQKDLIQLNQAAHKYNEKWYVRLLSIVFKSFKMKTLDAEIKDIDSKIQPLKEIKHISRYLKKPMHDLRRI